jgi:hypothetical protein
MCLLLGFTSNPNLFLAKDPKTKKENKNETKKTIRDSRKSLFDTIPRLKIVNNCLLVVCFETIWFCLTFDSLAAKTSLLLERQKLSDFRFGFRFEFIDSFRIAHKYSHEVSLVSL